MKKVVMSLSVVGVVVVLVGADFRRNDSPTTGLSPQVTKPCYGYTIIEFGKGIDCNGDTVKLVKVNGGQQRLVEPR